MVDSMPCLGLVLGQSRVACQARNFLVVTHGDCVAWAAPSGRNLASSTVHQLAARETSWDSLELRSLLQHRFFLAHRTFEQWSTGSQACAVSWSFNLCLALCCAPMQVAAKHFRKAEA